MLLEGKVALITGASRGIGKAIATLFAKEGARVIIVATNEETAKKAALDVGHNAVYKIADVSKKADVDQLVASVLQDFGTVDILVNNAGITRDGLLMKMSEKDFDDVIAVNLKSAYNTCQSLTRPFLKAKKGKIINIASVIGLIGNPGQTNYAAAKAGMIGFTKSLALELGSRGINVNCIAPGFIETDMTNALSDEQKASILQKVPLQRLGKPNEIAAAALFLASAHSDYITGQTLTVDGGMVM